MENIDIVTLLVQLVSGALGGNIVGGILRRLSLGVVGNTLAGIIGGGIGGQLLTVLYDLPGAAPTGGLDPTALGGQVASGAIGGAVVMLVVGILKSLFAK
jgi:hypothetical protein